MRILAVLIARFAIEGALAAKLFKLPLGLGLCVVGDVCDVTIALVLRLLDVHRPRARD